MPVFVGAGTSSFMKSDGGVGVSTMTTTERNALSGVKKGQIIFNETLNLAQYYDGTSWKTIDSPPTINNFTLDGGSAVTSANIDATAGGNATIVINGSLFDVTGAVVTFEGTGERQWPAGYNPKPLIAKSIREEAAKYLQTKLTLRRV